MPSASDELRLKWGGECGVGDDKAVKFLEGRGYCLLKSWTWLLPSKGHEVADDEFEAMQFLAQEWDYGSWTRGWAVGDRVIKERGYSYPGTVVAAFHTLGRQRRVVVESSVLRGMLHIYNEDQLRPMEETADGIAREVAVPVAAEGL